MHSWSAEGGTMVLRSDSPNRWVIPDRLGDGGQPFLCTVPSLTLSLCPHIPSFLAMPLPLPLFYLLGWVQPVNILLV